MRPISAVVIGALSLALVFVDCSPVADQSENKSSETPVADVKPFESSVHKETGDGIKARGINFYEDSIVKPFESGIKGLGVFFKEIPTFLGGHLSSVGLGQDLAEENHISESIKGDEAATDIGATSAGHSHHEDEEEEHKEVKAQERKEVKVKEQKAVATGEEPKEAFVEEPEFDLHDYI